MEFEISDIGQSDIRNTDFSDESEHIEIYESQKNLNYLSY